MERRQIFDYLEEKERTRTWNERSYNLVIDKYKTNPIDTFFREQFTIYNVIGLPFSPRMILGWYVLAKNETKSVEGKIIDIYPSRDLLIKTSSGLNTCVPFDHVKILRRNKP